MSRKYEKVKSLSQKFNKLKWAVLSTPFFLNLMNPRVYAATINTAEVNTATENIKNAVMKLSMPIGTILMFVSIVIISLKMIANSGNPNKRTESIGALAWVAGGFMQLGLALIISGIVLSIATNGSGGMIGGGASA